MILRFGLLALMCFPAVAASLGGGTAKVCLQVAPFAAVSLTQPISLEPLNQGVKGPKHYRGQSALLLEANTDVELFVMASSMTDGIEVVTPQVKVDRKLGQIEVPYTQGGTEHRLDMDVSWSADHIQKAGFYEGQVSVIVSALNTVDTCL